MSLSAKVKVPPPLQIQQKLHELVSICIKYIILYYILLLISAL